MRINGVPTSEFLLHAYAAATVGVPVVFVSGDWQLCTDIKETNPNITAVAVSEGIGPSTVTSRPRRPARRSARAFKQALQGDLKKCLLKLPETLHAGDRVSTIR